ncbi:hypothetical protein VTH06DRAFT_1078, partial [Thermothelomyces fergusii]
RGTERRGWADFCGAGRGPRVWRRGRAGRAGDVGGGRGVRPGAHEGQGHPGLAGGQDERARGPARRRRAGRRRRGRGERLRGLEGGGTGAPGEAIRELEEAPRVHYHTVRLHQRPASRGRSRHTGRRFVAFEGGGKGSLWV